MCHGVSAIAAISPKSNVQAPKTVQSQGTYMGRFVRWLNNTPGGQFTKGIGHAFVAGGTVLGALALLKAALATAVFAVIMFVTVIGIPVGLLAMPVTYLLVDKSIDILRLMPVFWNKALKNFENVSKLSAQEIK